MLHLVVDFPPYCFSSSNNSCCWTACKVRERNEDPRCRLLWTFLCPHKPLTLVALVRKVSLCLACLQMTEIHHGCDQTSNLHWNLCFLLLDLNVPFVLTCAVRIPIPFTLDFHDLNTQQLGIGESPMLAEESHVITHLQTSESPYSRAKLAGWYEQYFPVPLWVV